MNKIAENIDDFNSPIVRSMAIKCLSNKLFSEIERIGATADFAEKIEKSKHILAAVKKYDDLETFQQRVKKLSTKNDEKLSWKLRFSHHWQGPIYLMDEF